MSRYIEIDTALLKTVSVGGLSAKALWKRIMQQPHIDIVRCKDCKHGTYCKEAEMYICNANDQDLYEADHFCSYGERKSDE